MKESIQNKLEKLGDRYEELAALLSDPEVIGEQTRFRDYSREYAELEPVVQAFAAWRQAQEDLEEARLMLEDADAELRAMAREEIDAAQESSEQLEAQLQLLLLPKDPNDHRNVFLEIRAGTGGDEAAIFAGDLFRMYSRYAEQRGWRVEIVSASEGEHGGFKRSSVGWWGRASTGDSSSNPAPIGYSACRKPNPRGESIPPPVPWR